MSKNPEEDRLRHQLGNLQHENMVLRRMLENAASHLENMVDSRCSAEAQQAAEKVSSRIKRALGAAEQGEAEQGEAEQGEAEAAANQQAVRSAH